jgi:hypothetical protein
MCLSNLKGSIVTIKGTIIFLSCLFISSCGQSNEEKLQSEKKDKEIYNRCVSKGVEYFKEIDSYPRLTAAPNKGKHAITVARERCKRAPLTAFPD